MNSLIALLQGLASVDKKAQIAARQPKRIRRLIILKNNVCYNAFLRAMKAAGITPVKKIKRHKAVLCQMHPSTDLTALSKHAMVKRIELDRRLKLHVQGRGRGVSAETACASVNRSQIIPWGVNRIKTPKIWNNAQFGQGIRVAVLDTGVSPHPDLYIAGSFNAIDRRKSARDDNGHGTHVAGTIAALDNAFGVIGVAPKIKLYAVKAFARDGSAYVSDIIDGIDWCIANRIQIINMSFGMLDPSTTLQDAIRKAHRRGIVLVASCGNNGITAGHIDYPARYSETIAVAASTKDNRIAVFSSRGQGITVAAPGVAICSTILNAQYASMDGTSMAAPHVSGAAALLLKLNPGISSSQLKSRLKAMALTLSGFTSNAQGSGLVQVV